MASVPMATRQGALVGVLNVHTRARRDFLAADPDVLTAVGGLMAGGVENARLHATVAIRSVERARFAEQLVEVQERERQRIARDLHDGVSQRLTSLGFHLSAAAESLGRDDEAAALGIEQARGLSVAALDEARAAIHGLRPPVLDDLGLVAGFDSLARSVPGVRVAVEADPELSVPPHIELCLFRITQEALQNITKHSGADEAWISLRHRANRLVLEVADNGVGQPRQDARSTADSYGKQTMRERADMVGGTVRVQPRPGGGRPYCSPCRASLHLRLAPLCGLARVVDPHHIISRGLGVVLRRVEGVPLAAERIWSLPPTEPRWSSGGR